MYGRVAFLQSCYWYDDCISIFVNIYVCSVGYIIWEMVLQIYKCTKIYFKGSYAEVKTAAYVVNIKVQTKVSVLFQILKVFV